MVIATFWTSTRKLGLICSQEVEEILQRHRNVTDFFFLRVKIHEFIRVCVRLGQLLELGLCTLCQALVQLETRVNINKILVILALDHIVALLESLSRT